MPEVGDIIYIGSTWAHVNEYGGLATVKKLYHTEWLGEPNLFIEVSENPNYSYNWNLLELEQDNLKEAYGSRIAQEEPIRHMISHY
jgi:hypothetical protein